MARILCPQCKGKGRILNTDRKPNEPLIKVCPQCNGKKTIKEHQVER